MAGLALVPLSGPQASAASGSVRVTIEDGRNFGSQPVGSTTSRTVTVTNTGSSAVYIGTISVTSNDGAFGFDFDTNTCHPAGVPPYLAPGASCHYDVLFTPRFVGMNTGWTDVGADNISLILRLRGRGT